MYSPPLPSPGGSHAGDDAGFVWYGNIQYLLNISSIGALCCVFIFLFVKLRSDHSRMQGPSALMVKLLAVWHATGRDISCHCGADAAQFLIIEGGSCAVLMGISIFSLAFLLPLNLYGGDAPLNDQFSRTTICHIKKGSPLLWLHLLFVFIAVFLFHFGMTSIERRLGVTKLMDGYGRKASQCPSVFTIMVSGIPRDLAADRTPLLDYFQHKYPGKIYRVIVPFDLCALDSAVSKLRRVRDEMEWLSARIDAAAAAADEDEDEDRSGSSSSFAAKQWNAVLNVCGRAREFHRRRRGLAEEKRLRKLQETRAGLESDLAAYGEGRAPGARAAFIVFRDVYTVNRAVEYFRNEKRKRIGRFFSVKELELGKNRWKVERAAAASDIYWSHLGSSRLSLKLRRLCTNACLLLMLLFFTSPLAVITAVESAGRIIDAGAMDTAEVWLQSSSWAAALAFQFLPNVVVFVSMYVVVPSALSRLSKFERHLTVSGEQRSELLKLVCFFLVNLIVMRGLVESSLESWLLRMGRCYLEDGDCRRVEHYVSASFLSKSCLSSLAFLITCTFLGISYDLLAPVPWIKRNLRKLRNNDMLQLVPEEEDTRGDDGGGIRRPLLGADLSEYPVDGPPPPPPPPPFPKQPFDFAQYYAFNLTVLALTMIYSSFAPAVVPVGAVYFGYRYVVDKYNFMYVYAVRGFPTGNDGRLMDVVLCIARFCVDLFLLSMILYFSVEGDSTRLQAISTLALLIVYKLLPVAAFSSPPAFHGVQTITGEASIDYEVLSQPKFEGHNWGSQ